MAFLRAAGLGRRRALRAISPAKLPSRQVSRLIRRRSTWLYSGPVQLAVELCLPVSGEAVTGWVIAPSAGRPGASQPIVMAALLQAGFAVLTVDLLGQDSTAKAAAAFDTPTLSTRLAAVTRWLAVQPEARGQRVAYLASGVAAGAAFGAATLLDDSRQLAAIVSLDGRVD